MDDTIPLYHGYQHRLSHGMESAGRAVMATAVVLIAQFSLLSLSDFRPTAHFGMLCAVGLFSGEVFELLLMPALLSLRIRKPQQAVTAP